MSPGKHGRRSNRKRVKADLFKIKEPPSLPQDWKIWINQAINLIKQNGSEIFNNNGYKFCCLINVSALTKKKMLLQIFFFINQLPHLLVSKFTKSACN